ncbi:hypothetical protein CARUB_v10018328mg [Capsella rubella]|uniref:Uncharacterized protein n=1 Tax=Capsella rubella TaxID=81985 RepID=R0FLE8_9BRAS|nr:hypothetical protein CARUB_v10018328mg [Capsella rubella]
MNEQEAMEMKATLEEYKGEVDFYVCNTLKKKVSIKKNMVSISKEKKKEHQRVFTPSMIEPSFGIWSDHLLFVRALFQNRAKQSRG